jgi:hypothetical protein
VTRLNTSFVLGYHGCHKAIGLQAVAGKLELIQSEKAYDWLGPGVYFWEGDPLRALEWAQWKKFDEPFVIGAVIDLRNCLDLMVKENLDLLASAYHSYVAQQRKSGLKILENKSPRGSKSEDDKKLRFLDCAVITHLHKILDNEQSAPSRDLPAMVQPFDSVRGLFEEKPEVYPGSGFFKNSHSQIAIRNLDCIVEIFVPRQFHSAA